MENENNIANDKDFMSIDERKETIKREEDEKMQKQEEQRAEREAEKERKRVERKQQERTEKKERAEARTKINVEKERLRINQEEQRKTEAMAKQIEIESVKPKELKVAKLKPERESNIIPSGRQLKVMVKEAGIGIREKFKSLKQETKKQISMLPERAGGLVKKGFGAGIGAIKTKIAQNKAYNQRIAKTRESARFYAQKRKIYREELTRAGLIRPRKQAMEMQNSPVQEKRIGMPLFQPRQQANVGEKRTGLSLNIFGNREQKQTSNILEIKKATPTEKKGMMLFDFKKKRGMI
jgi:hypothetical protein